MSGQCLLTFVIHSTTSKWFLYTPWIISMQPHQEHFPHILPVMDLQKMLLHTSDALPPMLHLSVSSDDTLHFYRYLCFQVLIENKQFLLLIDVPIQDRSRQITIHKILTLSIPHGNFSACYDVNTKYLGITKDATMAVELSTAQLQVCQEANSQLCSITTSFQPLANPPSCVTTLYARSTADITSQCSLQIRKTSDVNLPTQISQTFGSSQLHSPHQQAPSL